MMLVLDEDRAAMSRKSKWIEAKSADEFAPAVARRAIRARLRTLWSWLPLAAKDAADDLEYVHQLRVASRRAMAVLEIFDGMLPRKRCKWFTRQLKRIRRAASEARDLDVLGLRLAAACNDDRSVAWIALLERVALERRAAQPPIRAIYRKLLKRGFRRRVNKLLAKLHWRLENSPPTFRIVAQAQLRGLAAPFFSAAEGDFASTLALHEFRIAAKQLRYAMEVFADAFAPTFRKELYPLVEELQEKLGTINDHADARDRYLAWLDDTQNESQRLLLGNLIALDTAALQQAAQDFRQWWTPARAADLKTRFWQEILPGELRCA